MWRPRSFFADELGAFHWDDPARVTGSLHTIVNAQTPTLVITASSISLPATQARVLTLKAKSVAARSSAPDENHWIRSRRTRGLVSRILRLGYVALPAAPPARP
jgi:hypothetical protein